MNRFITAIAIVTTLSIVQGCTQLAQVKEEPTMTTTTHSNAAHVKETDHSHLTTNETSHSEHGDAHANTSISTQAKLATAGVITPNTPTTLQIDIQDQDGNAIAQFDQFQEQIMHLIAASDDLQIFQHLHPTYKGNGRLEVETQFPQSGNYTLFSDYQPTGQAEQVSVLKTQVAGNNLPTAEVNWSRTKTFNETIVGFASTQATIRARQEVVLRFNLQDATSYQPISVINPLVIYSPTWVKKGISSFCASLLNSHEKIIFMLMQYTIHLPIKSTSQPVFLSLDSINCGDSLTAMVKSLRLIFG